MERYLKAKILEDLGKKLLIVSGPRQVGKTTLAQALTKNFEYLNYDNLEDRRRMLLGHFDSKMQLLILDEIHKMKKWKSWLKGLYDTHTIPQTIVTGSAKLNTFRRVGDSMAGRYFHYQLFPFDIKELVQQGKASKPNVILDNLLRLSGFPEPYLSKSEPFYKRWRQTHLDVVLRQDLVEISSVRHISQMMTLVELMRERAGQLFSYSSLREDLQSDDKSIKSWMNLLEEAYILFKITPFSKKIKNTLSKTPKYYFFDIPRVRDEGARFENLVALSLLKEVAYRRECLGQELSLHYLRNLNKQEVDFVICDDQKPKMLIECKLSDDTISSSLKTFRKVLGEKLIYLQLVKSLKRPYTNPEGIRVESAADWLATMEI